MVKIADLSASFLISQLIEPAAPFRDHAFGHRRRSVVEPVLNRLREQRDFCVQHRFEGLRGRVRVVVAIHEIAEQLPKRLWIPAVDGLRHHERSRQRIDEDIEANRGDPFFGFRAARQPSERHDSPASHIGHGWRTEYRCEQEQGLLAVGHALLDPFEPGDRARRRASSDLLIGREEDLDVRKHISQGVPERRRQRLVLVRVADEDPRKLRHVGLPRMIIRRNRAPRQSRSGPSD